MFINNLSDVFGEWWKKLLHTKLDILDEGGFGFSRSFLSKSIALGRALLKISSLYPFSLNLEHRSAACSSNADSERQMCFILTSWLYGKARRVIT